MTRNRVVKVRVTEAEYSDWTEMARSRSVSLSETIRRAMQGNPHLEPPKPLESLSGPLKKRTGYPWPTLLGEVIAAEVTSRRKEPCPHGKPGFAYCPECDS